MDIEKDKIKTDKKRFLEMCKNGCKNYNKKYSCPPKSPDFNFIIHHTIPTNILGSFATRLPPFECR